MNAFLTARAVVACGALVFAAVGASAPATGAGDTAFAAGDFAAAATDYAVAVAENPADAASNLGLATLALYRNDLVAAAHYIDLAAGNDTTNLRIARLRAALALRRDDANADNITPYHAPVTVPFEVTDPLPLVRVKVNGHDALFVIDTGAGNIVLDPQFAKEAGVTLVEAGNGIFAGGRQAPVMSGVAGNVRLGTVLVRNVAVSGLPTRGLPFFGERHPDGVLGTRFLAHFLPTLDYVRGLLILRPRSASAEVERDAERRHAFVTPMLLVGDHFIFARGSINAGPEGWLNVDTGLAGGGLTPSKAALADSQITLDEAHAEQGIGGGGPMRVVPFIASVTLAGRRVDGVQGLATPDGDQFGIFPFAVRGTVSHAYFRNVALTFDFDAMRLVMQP